MAVDTKAPDSRTEAIDLKQVQSVNELSNQVDLASIAGPQNIQESALLDMSSNKILAIYRRASAEIEEMSRESDTDS